MEEQVEVKAPVLRRLALMICGDLPYAEFFPYRTHQEITRFFDDLLLEWEGPPGSRNSRAEAALFQLANTGAGVGLQSGPRFLTPALTKVIAHIVDPVHFVRKEHYQSAVYQLNELLAGNSLHVVFDSSGTRAHVVSLDVANAPTGPVLQPGAQGAGVLVVRPDVFKVPRRRQLFQPQCGVLMPFGGLFDEIYYVDMAPTIERAGFDAVRADEIWKDAILINDIFDLIYHSSVIVADLSGRNPNVFYELGMAHMLGITVIPIVQSKDDIPFDLRHHRFLEYVPTAAGRKELASKLESRLQELAESLRSSGAGP